MIQLASLRYFGHHTPSWEPVQLRTFLEGRSDMYQAVLPTVAQFCAAMQDSSSPKGREGVQDGGQTRLARKRELFDLAAKQHSSVLARVSRGHGFNHHLTAMRELAIRTEDIPSFLDAPIYHRIRPGKLMTDCAEWFGEIQDGGMAMPDPEFVWVHYEIQKDGSVTFRSLCKTLCFVQSGAQSS